MDAAQCALGRHRAVCLGQREPVPDRFGERRGLEPLKEEEVDEIFGVAVGVGVAVVVAEVVAPPIGYGLVVPNGVAVGVGVGVVARATKLLDFGATVKVRVNVTSWLVSGSV